MTRSFRSHPLFRLFVTPKPKLESVEAVTVGATDTELARLTIEPGRRADDLRYSALTLMYGGGK